MAAMVAEYARIWNGQAGRGLYGLMGLHGVLSAFYQADLQCLRDHLTRQEFSQQRTRGTVPNFGYWVGCALLTTCRAAVVG